MNKLNKAYQGIKKNIGKIALGIVLVGAITRITSCIKNPGEEIYRGNINGSEIIYKEGMGYSSFPSDDNFEKNTMTINKNNRTYILDDVFQEKSVKAWDFKNQHLEKILIKENGIAKEYSSKKKYLPNLDDQHIKSVFEESNKLYNTLRLEIRNKIESDYKSIEDKIK